MSFYLLFNSFEEDLECFSNRFNTKSCCDGVLNLFKNFTYESEYSKNFK